LRLRVTYHRTADLVSDHDQQFRHGGVLVRVPAQAERGQQVELDLVTPDGQTLPVDARVLQVLPVGLALEFKPQSVPGLADAIAAARVAPPTPSLRAPEHVDLDAEADLGFALVPADPDPDLDPDPDPVPEPVPEPADDDDQSTATTAPARVAGSNSAKKMQLALHGSRDERAAILRDLNKTLHPLVLKNPNLQLDEVVAMAKMTTISPEVLKAIADRREWAGRPEIALALVRNPKTPAPLAIKLLANVSPAELRQLAKDTRTRAPIQAAARKRLLTP